MRPFLALLLLVASAAFAQDRTSVQTKPREDSASGGATAPRPDFRRNNSASQALFERLDKNKDGYLTGSELTSAEAATANWIGIDRDNDGRISRSEFTAVEATGVARQQP